MTVSQTEFRAALLDARHPPPAGLTDGRDAAAGRRYAVYRNNVAVSLTEALEVGFPVLRKLLGPETFKRLAGVFLRSHPPETPLMMYYGGALPGFLEDFEPLRHLGYLPDVARLELGLRQSYHAADHTHLDASALGGIDEHARLTFAPSLIHLPSPWPVWDIWQFNMVPDAPKPRAIAQHVLILRAEYDPEPFALSPAEGHWMAALMEGCTLGSALDRACAEDPAFDMARVLALLVGHKALTGLETG